MTARGKRPWQRPRRRRPACAQCRGTGWVPVVPGVGTLSWQALDDLGESAITSRTHEVRRCACRDTAARQAVA